MHFVMFSLSKHRYYVRVNNKVCVGLVTCLNTGANLSDHPTVG